MKAEIVTTGTELLLGDTIDTNAAYIARQLRDIGVNLFYKTTVGDNIARLVEVFRLGLSRSDVILVTGGLGPTVDDITREAVAEATGRELEQRPELVERLQTQFANWGRAFTANNLRQSFLPVDAVAIPNPVGTAPGFILEVAGCVIICMPGVPREMKRMMADSVLPYLQTRMGAAGAVILTRVLHTAGIGESAVDDRIGVWMRRGNPSVGLAAHLGRVDVRLTVRAGSMAEAQALLAPLEVELRAALGSAIYGVDDETLGQIVAGPSARSRRSSRTGRDEHGRAHRREPWRSTATMCSLTPLPRGQSNPLPPNRRSPKQKRGLPPKSYGRKRKPTSPWPSSATVTRPLASGRPSAGSLGSPSPQRMLCGRNVLPSAAPMTSPPSGSLSTSSTGCAKSSLTSDLRPLTPMLLFLFLDGVGMGADNASNPLAAADYPALQTLSAGRLVAGRTVERNDHIVRAIDACLGVEGLPQSATGQTTLFTGVNAPQLVGMHISAFPTQALRDTIAQHSIFKRARHAGRNVTFANAYSDHYWEMSSRRRNRHSATTWSVMAADLPFRDFADLARGEAVYWDITHEVARASYAPDLPDIASAEAGRRLAALAAHHDFVLWETFLPDLVGHRRLPWTPAEMLTRLDGMIAGLLASLPSSVTLLITSDHGNLEDPATKGHTYNPVPLIVRGPGAGYFAGVHDLTGVTPAILDYLQHVHSAAPSPT